MESTFCSIEAVKSITFPNFSEEASSLEVFEGNSTVPFQIERAFTVHANQAVNRGFHAHKSCSQLLVCVSGQCNIICKDTEKERKFCLNEPSTGLLIPPSIWAEQQYLSSPTVLMVLCDQQYDENDYIRDFEQFKEYRQAH